MICLNELTLKYNNTTAVNNISGTFEPNSLTAIVGPNGAGKSTLLKSMVGMHHPAQGACNCPCCREEIAYLPQLMTVDRSFPINVLDTVLLGHWRRVGAFKGIQKADYQMAFSALEAVGMMGFEKSPIANLSAGQFQRVLFARIQLQNASVILLDEPFTGMDLKTVGSLVERMKQWQAEERTIIAVLHDLDQVREHFPHTLLLARECIQWGKTEQVLTHENLTHAWSMAAHWGDTVS